MKHDYQLTAVARTALGKGASRRLRRANERVAAIIYGGSAEPQPIAIDKPAFYKALEEESFFSSIVNIDIDGKKEQVVIRDLQRHPYKELITHADFMRVDATHELTITVPLHFAGEDECKGVREQDGVLHVLANDVEVSCLPGDLPEYLEVNVANMAMGDTLHLSDIPLPKGITIVALTHGEDHDTGIVTITHPDLGTDEEDEGESSDDAPRTEADNGGEGEQA
ncbi:50S ribosomal protein L25/general stress protein Ctc [Kushneria phyllosphaerae]|uniref:Large ribosomal subunit protein bL25 n=1 Tax=Kushneria phyllosphaerae TaxID=2100822 RepID=A0A2R8CQH2_9GAMM|nr:50S ribosomal protein L25/general stress protein Ctc [Kushneria phyllosphaerae]SPJ35131.1 50S ribosomal protein L25 [Kushneria phyllosphaerae]